jgi:hypothetical protein
LVVPQFPTSQSAVLLWAHTHGLPLEQAQHRFVQFAVLDCAASDPLLSEILILRGAAALLLFHCGRRHTKDLDFLILNINAAAPDDAQPEAVKDRLNLVLNQRLQAYSQENQDWDQWLASIKIDLSPCRYVCECEPVTLRENPNRCIKVCTLEGIIADKLIAILAHREGNPPRGQDLFDIVSMITAQRDFDRQTIIELARLKAPRRQCRFALDA